MLQQKPSLQQESQHSKCEARALREHWSARLCQLPPVGKPRPLLEMKTRERGSASLEPRPTAQQGSHFHSISKNDPIDSRRTAIHHHAQRIFQEVLLVGDAFPRLCQRRAKSHRRIRFCESTVASLEGSELPDQSHLHNKHNNFSLTRSRHMNVQRETEHSFNNNAELNLCPRLAAEGVSLHDCPKPAAERTDAKLAAESVKFRKVHVLCRSTVKVNRLPVRHLHDDIRSRLEVSPMHETL